MLVTFRRGGDGGMTSAQKFRKSRVDKCLRPAVEPKASYINRSISQTLGEAPAVDIFGLKDDDDDAHINELYSSNLHRG